MFTPLAPETLRVGMMAGGFDSLHAREREREREHTGVDLRAKGP